MRIGILCICTINVVKLLSWIKPHWRVIRKAKVYQALPSCKSFTAPVLVGLKYKHKCETNGIFLSKAPSQQTQGLCVKLEIGKSAIKSAEFETDPRKFSTLTQPKPTPHVKKLKGSWEQETEPKSPRQTIPPLIQWGANCYIVQRRVM